MKTFGPIEKLGTVWWFEFFDLPDNKEQLLYSEIEKVMNEFERNYSRFSSESLLSELNTKRCIDNPSGELLDMLKIAQNAFVTSKEVFNIAIGRQLEQLGYDRQYSFLSQERDHINSLDEVLQISDKRIQLSGLAHIDFGGFGKGYLIDKLAELFLDEFGVRYFLINGGGDIYVTSDHEAPVTIGLQDPTTKEITGTLELKNQGFACSSPVLRQWKDQNGVAHDHLVGGLAKQTVYVTAQDATTADVWATTLAIDKTTDTPKDVQVHTV